MPQKNSRYPLREKWVVAGHYREVFLLDIPSVIELATNAGLESHPSDSCYHSVSERPLRKASPLPDSRQKDHIKS